MTSKDIISTISEYIENNICESLTPEMLAEKAGFSTYYFCKLFNLYKGMPVMEFIRRRRLAYAASDICENNKIIDVALNYGFESHNGFAKAFKKVYGFSPDEFRRRTASHRPSPPNPLKDLTEETANTMPICRIEHKDEFYLAGLVIHTSDDLSSIAQQPALWQIFELREAEHRIYALASPEEHGEYYISIPSEDGNYNLISGVKISNPDAVDKQLFIHKIPSSLYAIFSTPPCFGSTVAFAETIIKTWKYIFEVWMPDSGYTLDTDRADFEFYDERCHGIPRSMDIYIPIKKNNDK